MPWLEDVASLITAAGAGTLNVDTFLSTAASVPAGVGPYTLLVETGGMGLERLHSDDVGVLNAPAYERPGMQITVRATSYVTARTRARAVFDAVDGVFNTTINGTRYLEIIALQRPFDMGPDDSKRVRLAFNILGYKALS